jgi:threonine dehydrogenase-like Zn-dependent dehydrogenase
MKAVCWFGRHDVRVERLPDPEIVNARDAIVRVTRAAICGSDLHLYDGYIPAMKKGDVLGHEFVGEVVEVGPEVASVKPGDRVVVPFAISCGDCFYCKHEMYSLCDNSNPEAPAARAVYGQATAGLFGYSHLTGGYAGGQAQFVRVPYADRGCFKYDGDLDDEDVLFLGDILPTAWQAAEQGGVRRGDVVAVWGCGPVGQLAIKCAYLLGAERVIAIDEVRERLDMAHDECNAETLDFAHVDVLEALAEMTGGRGPDVCIDAVGMEAHGLGLAGAYDRAKRRVRLQTDQPAALRQAILACRKGGTVSIPGVYGGLVDKFPIGAAFQKGLTLRMGQTHVHKYVPSLLDRVARGEIDARFVISHRFRLDDAAMAYSLFHEKRDGCVKIVLDPS